VVTAFGTGAICGTLVVNTASDTCQQPCQPPDICITKGVACDLGAECGTFSENATGYKNPDTAQYPAFCYKITVTNCGSVDLKNVTVTDSKLNLSGCSFPSSLAIGQTVQCVIPNVTQSLSVVNTATATGQSTFSSETVSAHDTATVTVKPIGITCAKFVSVDGGEPVTDVTLSAGSHTLTYTVEVTNTGSAQLSVTVTDPGITNCATPSVIAPFLLDVGSTTTKVLCALATISCEGTPSVVSNTVTVTGAAVSNSGTECVLDQAGNEVTASSNCSATVRCPAGELGCRVTGGGKLFNVNAVTTPGALYSTHGGQVGAPFSTATAFDPDSNCITGQWEHVRHKKVGNFHGSSFDSLMCACLGCVGPDGTVYPPEVNEVCNPDNRVCGPEPRRAPANKICFSGVGNWQEETGRRARRIALFRVDIEDRSEPGGNPPGQGNKEDPADRYRIRIWVLTNGELNKLNNPSDRLLDFRRAIACSKATTVLTDGAVDGNGNPVPLGTAVFGVRRPDIDDGGELDRGNHQIHPVIKSCD
jgi:hypothetical protein